MKCLCCGKVFDDQSLPKEHYVTCHNVDKNNYFFKKLFTRDGALCRENVFDVNIFVLIEEMKKITTLFLSTN